MPGLLFCRMLTVKNILPLKSIAQDTSTCEKFAIELETRIEARIRALGALKGLVARNAYAAAKAVRPGYVRHILKVLSRDYIEAYTPLHEVYRASQTLPCETVAPLIDFIRSNKTQCRDIFWRIADKYGNRHKDHFLGKAYAKFKPTIEEYLPAIACELAQAIEMFTVADAS